MAIMLAVKSPALKVLGITCVAGNVELAKVVPNTLNILHAVQASDIPVAAGLERPFIEIERNAKNVHGEDGLGHLGLPPSPRPAVDEHAVAFLRRNLMGADAPITLIPLAPLTNIATLLLQHPEVKPKIGQMVIMGGAVGTGNATAVAEFNIRQDPEAAEIVFTSGLPIVMYTLDVFRQVTFSRAEARALIQSNQPAAHLSGRLLEFYMDTFEQEQAGIGDAGAVASVIEPAGLTTKDYPVRVELAGQWTRGQTVVDRRAYSTISHEAPWQPAMGSSVNVAIDIDRERYRQIFRDTVLTE
jgi:pyrimidine-specific ribonucleoside hydrolase